MEVKALYTPEELQALRRLDAVTILDIRTRDRFAQGHIPGAVNLPEIFYSLFETTPPGLASLHRDLSALLSRAGIRRDKPVILYEDSLETWCGASCRGYWLLSYLGHPHVGILERGFTGWRFEGLPVDTQETLPTASRFEILPQHAMLATRDEVKETFDSPSTLLIDNRDRDEWEGRSSSPYGIDYAPRKGRIPGARWIEWYRLMVQHLAYCTFRSPEEIRALCAGEGLDPHQDLILYCFKGSRSANTYLALKLAGFTRVRLYLGSWNEWSRDPSLPIDAGLL